MQVMHHPLLSREINALSEGQARVFEKSGWVRGPLPQPATAKSSPVVRKQQPSKKEIADG